MYLKESKLLSVLEYLTPGTFMAKVNALTYFLRIRNSKGKELEHLTYLLSNIFLFNQVVLSLAFRINIVEEYCSTPGKSKLKKKFAF